MSALLPGAPFLGWLIEALVASTLLMGLALLIRCPVREAFGPQIAYALWALPLLRLLLSVEGHEPSVVPNKGEKTWRSPPPNAGASALGGCRMRVP